MAAARLLGAPHHTLKKKDGVSPRVGTMWLTDSGDGSAHPHFENPQLAQVMQPSIIRRS